MIDRQTDRALSSERVPNISSFKAAAAVFSRHNIYQWEEKGVQVKTSSVGHTQDVVATMMPGSLIPATICFHTIPTL